MEGSRMISRLLRSIRAVVRNVNVTARRLGVIEQSLLHSEFQRLRADERYDDPKHLMRYGAKIYSQCDEDGIVAEIFRRIGTTTKSFVEFGIGNGLENNSHALLFDGWHGLWIDASTEAIRNITTSYAELVHSGRLRVVESFITRDNIDELIVKNVDHNEIDFLSIDIDGNDVEILLAIRSVNPRVIAMEYNAKFVPPLLYCMDYNANHYWRGGDCFGASLKFLEVSLRQRGYSLVGCSISGANAFFVRNDLVGDKFLQPFTAEFYYEPARYHLIEMASGHVPSFSTLAQSRASEEQSL